ncbi:hypothetical protein G6F31_018037 [Rhizopus arrhizus]|nr:hypothetical protein G6F31_018037 [Rhizopus arrhizus]
MGGYTYMQFIVPGLLLVLRRQVRPPRGGTAGQPDAELGDPVGLRSRCRAARPDGGRDRADHRDVLHPGAHPAPDRDADHGDPGRDDLLAGRLHQRGIREEVRRRGDRADLHPDPAAVSGWRVLFGETAAGLGRGGHARESDLLQGQCVRLWPAGQQRRSSADGLRADDRFRGGADGAGAVAAAPWRGHA